MRLAKSWEVMSWSRSREGETARGEAMWLGILNLGMSSHGTGFGRDDDGEVWSFGFLWRGQVSLGPLYTPRTRRQGVSRYLQSVVSEWVLDMV